MIFLAFFFGCLLGSFFNVVIFRLPEDKPIAKGRSLCRHCGKTVPAYLNIPLLSYAILGGKTRCCGKGLSLQYPLVEASAGILFVALFLKFGMGPQFASYATLGSFLLIISVIDYHHQIIPDELSLSGIVLGFLASFATGDVSWQSSLLGVLAGGGVFFCVAYLYEKVAKQEGLGGGDIKLLAMLGAWFGAESVLILVILSTLSGSIVGLGLMLAGKANSKAAIPFGPFLAGAALVYLFFREPLLAYFYPFEP